MSEYMMTEIMQGINYYGAKEELLQQLVEHKSKQHISFGKLVRYYKTDTSNHYLNDSLVNLLELIASPESEYEIAFLYLTEKDTLAIDSIMESIPMVFTLSTEQEETHDLYSELFDILTKLIDDTYEIDSSMHQRIVDLYNETGVLPGIYARNLLIAHKLFTYVEPVYLADNPFKNSQTFSPNNFKLKENTSYLKIFPNPSRTYFIIEFDLGDFNEPGTILISDEFGSTLKKYSLLSRQNQIIISNNQFSSGLYLLRLYVGNRLLCVEKVVIQ